MALTRRARAARDARRAQLLLRFRQAELNPVALLGIVAALFTFGLISAAL